MYFIGVHWCICHARPCHALILCPCQAMPRHATLSCTQKAREHLRDIFWLRVAPNAELLLEEATNWSLKQAQYAGHYLGNTNQSKMALNIIANGMLLKMVYDFMATDEGIELKGTVQQALQQMEVPMPASKCSESNCVS